MSLHETHTAFQRTAPVALTDVSLSWARLDGVDILRGLAIFFVLMNHVNMRLILAKIPYTQGLPSQLVSSFVWSGQYGVQMFFAVSGFLITSTSIRRWGSLSRVSMRDFYTLRFARIAPLLLLLLAVLCTLHAAGLKDFAVSDKTGGLGRALLAALTFHVNVLEAHRGYLPGNWDILWSLSVEEMFYLFFPLVCWLLGRGRRLVTFLLILVVLGPFSRTTLSHGNEVWQEYSYLGGMDAIALGCLTAIVSSRTTSARRVIWALAGLGTVLVLFILGLSHQARAWGLERSGLDMTILALGSCMVIVAAAQSSLEKPARHPSAGQPGSAQLRNLSDSHVRSIRTVWAVQVSAGLTRRRAGLVHQCRSHFRTIGRLGRALLFRTDESPDSSTFRGWARTARFRRSVVALKLTGSSAKTAHNHCAEALAGAADRERIDAQRRLADSDGNRSVLPCRRCRRRCRASDHCRPC